MSASLPPFLIFFLGAALAPFLKDQARRYALLLFPIWGLLAAIVWPEGSSWSFHLWDYQLVLMKVDRLSRVFGIIFTLISVLGVLFAIRVADPLQHAAALVYAGAALGVTYAGDWFSLYFYWEVMALASTFLILARRTVAARRAAFRYVMVHLAGGLILLAGIIMLLGQGRTITVGHIGLDGAASWLVFLGIAVNAAIPPLHPWLKDAYPEATPTGAVFLSAFTTKSAVYLMCRTFAGAEVLIWLGAIMTCFPIFYAVLENDIRRVLSYSLMNQVGFMMCGVGIGTTLAINGTVSHAFCHIIYKALLFMAAGSVMTQTGKIRCTDLGGLYKYMPFTAVCCMIASASISAFPLFSGFISKSMIITAAGNDHLVAIWLMLQFASAGVVDHAGIKVPYFMFFGQDSGLRPPEAPWNMRLAMGLAAFFCVGIGVFPQPLYAILPYAVDYAPYTGMHVVGQLQLLLFGALAFCLLMYSGYYPAEIRAINLDTDWFYRKGSTAFYRASDLVLNAVNAAAFRWLAQGFAAWAGGFARRAANRWGVGLAALWWQLSGVPARDLPSREARAGRALDTGTVPVGVGMAAAVVLLLVVFIMALR
ncbi:MAG: Na(+)/H(+) antiporter subunit D [Deltaproteobacteria bacterium]|nr:Na(+)/H(+) antiporter subunit D [Deltaproteobacteria bacterium]